MQLHLDQPTPKIIDKRQTTVVSQSIILGVGFHWGGGGGGAQIKAHWGVSGKSHTQSSPLTHFLMCFFHVGGGLWVGG